MMALTGNNFYRQFTWQCVECGKDYHPCSPNQKACSHHCASTHKSRVARERSIADLVPLTINRETALIPLTKGAWALCDLADWPELIRYSWYLHDDGGAARGYSVRTAEGKRHKIKRMHQQILPCEPGFEPDHKNLNRLDNRRSNLRVATRSEQVMNQRLKCNNRSGFRGVAWSKEKNKWLAYITKDGKRRTIGYFDDKRSAAICRAAVAKFVFGEFARESA